MALQIYPRGGGKAHALPIYLFSLTLDERGEIEYC